MAKNSTPKERQPLEMQWYGPRQIEIVKLIYAMGGTADSQRAVWKHLRFAGDKPSVRWGQYALNRARKAGLIRYEPIKHNKRKVKLTQRGYLLAWRECGYPEFGGFDERQTD